MFIGICKVKLATLNPNKAKQIINIIYKKRITQLPEAIQDVVHQ
jgi:hypothetical protein